tara:strand:- start:770 stop:961 length:192 start_codon:yes stop_codon:yes gene_type:complete
MASQGFYAGWSKIDLAEHMVEHIERFEDRSPHDLADKWDRCDMQEELADAEIEADTEKEEGEQ